MSQTRYIDYASSVTSNQINTINKTMSSSGILESTGNILKVVGNTIIRVNPYKIITPDGIIILEDTTQDLTVNLTYSAKNYTIVLRHSVQKISGGNAAYVEVLENLYEMYSFTDATVLGWVIYPGNTVVLDDTMIYLPRFQKNTEPSVDQAIFQMSAPFTQKWYVLNGNADILLSEMYLSGKVFTRVTNTNTIIIRTSSVLIPFVATEYMPSIVRITARADFQAGCIVSIVDEFGVQYNPNNNIISNTDWGIFEIKLANFNGLNIFKKNETCYLKLVFQLNPGKTLDIQSVALSDYNIPKPETIFSDVQFAFTFTRISSCLNFYNPAISLPVAPLLGDRYISSWTANGWSKDIIYEWNGLTWTATTPTTGDLCRITQVMPIEDYLFAGVWTNSVPTHLVTL